MSLVAADSEDLKITDAGRNRLTTEDGRLERRETNDGAGWSRYAPPG
jgi:hypothetical protein